MKKITLLAILLLVLFVFSSCFLDQDTPDSSTPQDASISLEEDAMASGGAPIQPASDIEEVSGAESGAAPTGETGTEEGATGGETGIGAGAPEDTSAEGSVTGVIVSSGMGKFSVELDNGITVDFDYTTADTSALSDSRPGSPVTVYFTGVLEGNDTSGIFVTRMETPA